MIATVDQITQVLECTPGTRRALLSGLPESWTSPHEGPDTFSAFDNVGHLVPRERTDWIPRARIILAQRARVMANQYRDAVGPWRPYLPLLDRP